MKRYVIIKLWVRLRVCYKILFRKYDHWLILNVDEENLIRLLKREDFNCDADYHGIQPYIFHRMIKMVSNSKDEDDLLLDRIAFEAEATKK